MSHSKPWHNGFLMGCALASAFMAGVWQGNLSNQKAVDSRVQVLSDTYRQVISSTSESMKPLLDMIKSEEYQDMPEVYLVSMRASDKKGVSLIGDLITASAKNLSPSAFQSVVAGSFQRVLELDKLEIKQNRNLPPQISEPMLRALNQRPPVGFSPKEMRGFGACALELTGDKKHKASNSCVKFQLMLSSSEGSE